MKVIVADVIGAVDGNIRNFGGFRLMAKIIEVIECYKKRGRGIDMSDPVRNVRQLWTKDGKLLCEWDHDGNEETLRFASQEKGD